MFRRRVRRTLWRLLLLGLSATAATGLAATPEEEPPGNAPRNTGIFGTADDTTNEVQPRPTSPWTLHVDRAMLEFGVLAATQRPVDTVQSGQGVVTAQRYVGERWTVRLGARLDAQLQQGGAHPSRSRIAADYAENYLRYRGEQLRLTVGTQKILWGRVDELPPTDRLSTPDLTRFGLDDLAERRRASPALRLEYFAAPWHVDAVMLPLFRPAELPDRDSLWHPVDRTRGRLLGLPADPRLEPLISDAELDDAVSGSGGGGVRLSRTGRGGDFAVTVQRVRLPEPYFRLDDATREALLAGVPPAQAPVLEVIYPRSWLVGGDLVVVRGAWSWRLEAAWLSDVPATRADTFEQVARRGVDWVVGVEGYPGGGDFRATTQLSGQHLLDADGLLDADESYFLAGELEQPFADHQWRATLRYSFGLDRRDHYLHPELAWVGWEPYEWYFGLHSWSGHEARAGGFFRDHRLLVAGWRGQF